jgi:hypothetical protein
VPNGARTQTRVSSANMTTARPPVQTQVDLGLCCVVFCAAPSNVGLLRILAKGLMLLLLLMPINHHHWSRYPFYQHDVIKYLIEYHLILKHTSFIIYYLQGNGDVQSTNKIFGTLLIKLVNEIWSDWDEHLSTILFLYQTPYKVGTGHIFSTCLWITSIMTYMVHVTILTWWKCKSNTCLSIN